MDEHRPASRLISALLLGLCALVAAAGTAWTAWDMTGPSPRPMLQGWDDSFYYYWLPSVVIDHDLDFTNQLAHSGTVSPGAREAGLAQPRTATGLLPNKYPPGWALGSLPFFLAAHLTAPPGSTGFEPRYLLAVWFGQLLYAAAGLWFAWRIVARFASPETAALAVAVIWLASPLAYYQSARLGMSHSQVFALAAAATWLALRIVDGDDRRRTWLLLGFCSALLVVTRNVAVIYLAYPLLVVAHRLRSVRAGVALAAGVAGPLAVQLVAWRLLYGSWLAYSYGGERFHFAHPHFVAVLFSPRHGWFYWHPLLAVAIAAFVLAAVSRNEVRIWLVSLAAIVVLNAAWSTWWLGSSFGHRGFDAATLFAMIGFALLWQQTAARPGLRRVLAGGAGLAIAWNLALLALFLTHRISREDAVTWGDAARALAGWIHLAG